MVTKIIWLSFLLGVVSTIAVLLYLLLSVNEPKRKEAKSKKPEAPKNEIQFEELLRNHKQSKQATESA